EWKDAIRMPEGGETLEKLDEREQVMQAATAATKGEEKKVQEEQKQFEEAQQAMAKNRKGVEIKKKMLQTGAAMIGTLKEQAKEESNPKIPFFSQVAIHFANETDALCLSENHLVVRQDEMTEKWNCILENTYHLVRKTCEEYGGHHVEYCKMHGVKKAVLRKPDGGDGGDGTPCHIIPFCPERRQLGKGNGL
ncbi:hypothetical protein CBR_g75623, partial [Chara braunii]